MKKKNYILIISIFFLINININVAHSNPYGEGKLQLSENMVLYFIKYIRGKGANQNPSDFYITMDGTNGVYWTCYSSNNCQPGSAKEDIKYCERQTGKKCKKFARRRTVKWKNGINPGKGKVSKISSKLSDKEIRDKLNELGFYKNEISTSEVTETAKSKTKKIEEKKTKVAKKNTSKGDLDGFMNALEKAKSVGLTIDPDQTAKQFGFKNFEDFFDNYKRAHDIGDITLEEARDFLLGSDNTIEIVESQENLDKLYELAFKDKAFKKYQKKKDSYTKTFERGSYKKNQISMMALAIYINYEKEMSKISKNPNLEKISRFAWDWGYSWGTGTNPFKYALEGCEKQAKKYKLSGGECIIIDHRTKNPDKIVNYLKPRLKDKIIKKAEKKIELTKKKKVEIDQKDLDEEPPTIEISENITVKDPNFEISGKVKDKGTNIIYVKADNQDIPVENGIFKIKKYSPIDTQIKITAIDEWGNETSKTVKIIIDKKETEIVEKLEPLNPSIINVDADVNKVALIIGIENYADIVKASYANSDAQYFKEYATKGLGIQNNNIKLLVDEDATFIKINKALKKWLKSKIIEGKTDLIIFYAGHGLASKDGKELYLLPQDGDADLLSISSISRTNLFNEIEGLNPKSVTIFLDACYTGSSRDNEILLADARPVRITADEQDDFPDNFTIFSASKNTQISSGLKKAKHGIFSYYLMKGLEGNADSNNDKKITNGELLAYMDEKVSQKAAELGRQQNPSLAGDPDKVLMIYK